MMRDFTRVMSLVNSNEVSVQNPYSYLNLLNIVYGNVDII